MSYVSSVLFLAVASTCACYLWSIIAEKYRNMLKEIKNNRGDISYNRHKIRSIEKRIAEYEGEKVKPARVRRSKKPVE